MGQLIVVVVLAFFAMFVISRIARVVPQQQGWVVERLGKFAETLQAGFHILIPFLDTVRYKHSLKEVALEVPEQVCITKDNVQVAVDGVLYFKVLDPERASYGISDYNYAISQLAQTNLRSEIGKIELDKTFEERTNINSAVVSEVDKASEAWGVKVLRYEIKNITPPQDVLAAMEKQMRAEREKLSVENPFDVSDRVANGEMARIVRIRLPAVQPQRSGSAWCPGGRVSTYTARSVPSPTRSAARAAAFAQHVVIMDEPTAALGVKETHMVLDLIRRVRER